MVLGHCTSLRYFKLHKRGITLWSFIVDRNQNLIGFLSYAPWQNLSWKNNKFAMELLYHSRNRVMVLGHCTSLYQAPSSRRRVSYWYLLSKFWAMLWTKFKYEKYQRAITLKSYKIDLWFLCTALLFIKLHLPMKFHIDTSYRFWAMLWTKFKYEK